MFTVRTEITVTVPGREAEFEDGGARLKQLQSRLNAQGMSEFRFATVHPAEISKELLETLGFRPAGGHLLYAARARPG